MKMSMQRCFSPSVCPALTTLHLYIALVILWIHKELGRVLAITVLLCSCIALLGFVQCLDIRL